MSDTLYFVANTIGAEAINTRYWTNNNLKPFAVGSINYFPWTGIAGYNYFFISPEAQAIGINPTYFSMADIALNQSFFNTGVIYTVAINSGLVPKPWTPPT